MNETLYGDVKQGVIDTIKAMNMSQIMGNVFGEFSEDPTHGVFPCIVCTCAAKNGDEDDADEMREKLLGGDTESRDWELPVKVFILGKDSSKDHAAEAKYLTWRKQLMDRFHQPSRPKLILRDYVWNVVVKPKAIIDTTWPRAQYIVSGMVVRVTANEKRG